MGYEPLVKQNPLRILKMGTENIREMGLVMSRPGLGKTALLVQIALDSILRGNRVIHVSIGESIDKTRIWYDDILRRILQKYSVTQPHELIEMVRHNRMIMTFKESAFNRAKFEERLNDLVMQNIFKPNCLVIDGFDFENVDSESLIDIKELAKTMSMQIWFSAVSHRDDERVSSSGIPAPCHEVDDLFDTVILLKPEGSNIRLNIVRNNGKIDDSGVSLDLDPSTMIITRS